MEESTRKYKHLILYGLNALVTDYLTMWTSDPSYTLSICFPAQYLWIFFYFNKEKCAKCEIKKSGKKRDKWKIRNQADSDKMAEVTVLTGLID